MMKEWTRQWLEGLAAMLIVLFAPLGAVAYCAKALWVRTSLTIWPWVLIWSALILLGIVHFLREGGGIILAQVALGLILAVGLHSTRRQLRIGIIIGLGIILLAGFSVQWATRNTWHSYSYPLSPASRLLGAVRGIERLEGRDHRSAFGQIWHWPTGSTTARLSLEARLIEGEPGWSWYKHDRNLEIESIHEADGSFTRVYPDAGATPHISRRVNIGESVGGRSFRATLELRASSDFQTQGCHGIILSALFSGSRTCLPVALTSTWQRFEAILAPPEDVTSTVIALELRGIASAYFDVRNVILHEWRDGGWEPIDILEPNGVLIRLNLPGTDPALLPSRLFIPTDRWEKQSLEISSETLGQLDQVIVFMQVEGGTVVEIRQTELTIPGIGAPQPLPGLFEPRSRLWFGQANLLGHTLAANALVLLSTRPPVLSGILGLAFSLGGIYLTGSRAAWLALLIGGGWLIWFMHLGKHRRIWFLLLLALSLVILAFAVPGRLQIWQLDDANTVARTEIWGAAWNMLTSQPWTGVGEEGFMSAWQAQHAEDRREAPTHAHNLWLQFGAIYGIPGLLAALWLSGGLLIIAWRWGRWRGLGLVVPVLIMQLFDYTLFYAGVLFPLILGLNTLRQGTESSGNSGAG